MYTIADCKTDLEGRLHGTSLNDVKGPNELIARAGRQLLLDCDPAETRQISTIEASFFDGVYDYAAPADLKGNKIIDIRPQFDRQPSDNIHQTSSRFFDLHKDQGLTYTVEHNKGQKVIRLAIKKDNSGILVASCDDLLTPTAWTGNTQIRNLSIDNVTKVRNGGALRFDLVKVTGGALVPLIFSKPYTLGNGVLTGVSEGIDLSAHFGIGSIFAWVFMPDKAKFTSISLAWGNDTNNKYLKTVTTGHYQPFHNGWNLLRFDYETAIEYNSVDLSNVTFLEFEIATTEDVANIRIDAVYSRIPYYYELVYYSKYLFTSPEGVLKDTVDSDQDTVNLDTESYNLLLDQAEYLALRQLKQNGYDADVDSSKKQYEKNVKTYQAQNKSQVDQTKQKYYHIFKPHR